MSNYFPNGLQSIFLSTGNAVLSLQDYWNANDCQTFPSQYLALQAVNEKAKQILNAFVNQNPPSSDLVNLSLSNLTSSYNHCQSQLNSMEMNPPETTFESGAFTSVEFFVTDIPRPNGILPQHTVSQNVQLFSKTVKKTKHLKKTFEEIVRLSRWPSYHDVIVESTLTGGYTVKRRATSKAVEILALATLILIGVICIALKTTHVYFSSVSTESE